MNWIKLLGCCTLVLLGTAVQGQNGAPSSELEILFDEFIPDTGLTYTTFLRECQDFTNNDADQVWVVNFWASHNSASLYSLPKLKAVYAAYKLKPIRFVSISVDKNRRTWVSALMREELSWEQLHLPSDEEYGFLRRAFKHRSFPAIFIVHLDGRIQRMVDVEQLSTELARITNSLPNTPFEPYFPDNEGNGEDPVVNNPDPNDFIEHTVVRGETLYSLQQKYGVKWQEIKTFNKLPSTRINIGQIIKVPKK